VRQARATLMQCLLQGGLFSDEQNSTITYLGSKDHTDKFCISTNYKNKHN
jgi:hypothetical protein